MTITHSCLFMFGVRCAVPCSWLRIQDCPSLKNTLGLANLRKIRGTPDRGLVIWNNDKLESIKGLENLPEDAIEAGKSG